MKNSLILKANAVLGLAERFVVRVATAAATFFVMIPMLVLYIFGMGEISLNKKDDE